MTTVDVKLKLSDEVMKYLQREASHRNMPFDDVVSDVLADYFDESSHEELLAGLKRSLEQVVAGDYRPAREFLDEIDEE
jgi:predicted transcriptional regulator